VVKLVAHAPFTFTEKHSSTAETTCMLVALAG